MIVSLYSNVARSLRHSNGHERDASIWPDVNHDDQWKWKEEVLCSSLPQSGSLGHPAREVSRRSLSEYRLEESTVQQTRQQEKKRPTMDDRGDLRWVAMRPN